MFVYLSALERAALQIVNKRSKRAVDKSRWWRLPRWWSQVSSWTCPIMIVPQPLETLMIPAFSDRSYTESEGLADFCCSCDDLTLNLSRCELCMGRICKWCEYVKPDTARQVLKFRAACRYCLRRHPQELFHETESDEPIVPRWELRRRDQQGLEYWLEEQAQNELMPAGFLL